MTDKAKLEEIKKLADAMYYAAQYLTTDASRLRKAMEEYHQFVIHEYFNEKPVSEELEEAAEDYGIRQGAELKPFAIKYFKAGAKWQKEQFEKDCTDLCNGIATAKGIAVAMAYDKGMDDAREQMMKNLWKPADGDDLPEYEREVVAFQETFPTDVDVPSLLKIVIAHRPNPEGYDGKSITTGQVEHYTPKTYDKGGWNIPDIKYWLDVELPKEIEL